MINKLGLRQEIDSRLHLLKKHLPYHESDHVVAPHAGADHSARGHRLYLDRRIAPVGWARSQIYFRNDAHAKVMNLAEAFPQEAWKPLERFSRYEMLAIVRGFPLRTDANNP
jgi:hypothetical protein